MSEPAISVAFRRELREHPDAIATIDGDRQRTLAELGLRTRRMAHVPSGLGVNSGDQVSLLAANGDVFAEVLLETLWAGGVIAPVNTRWTAMEIGFLLADSGSRVLVVASDVLPLLPAVREAAPCVEHVLATEGRADGCFDFEALLARVGDPVEIHRYGEDLAAILYTAGTTGVPKGIMLPHRALMTYARDFAQSGERAHSERMLHTAPLFHVGAIYGLLAGPVKGSRHVLLPGSEAGAAIADIAGHRVTDLFLVPALLQAVLDHPEFTDRDRSSVENVYSGAAPIAPALMDRAIAAMPRIGFVRGYGMTETSGSISLLKPADHRDPVHIRSAGRAVPSTQLRVVDGDDGDVAPGETGEILARGDAVMAGYWNRPAESAEALRGGWMHTGDIGRIDADGFVFVIDRLKDMIVTGGENVYSVEAEAALASHSGVAQLAVIGRPDDRWGETVHAELVLWPGAVVTAEELIAHCRVRLAGYKAPRSIAFRAAVPVSAAGRILKAELRSAPTSTEPIA